MPHYLLASLYTQLSRKFILLPFVIQFTSFVSATVNMPGYINIAHVLQRCKGHVGSENWSLKGLWICLFPQSAGEIICYIFYLTTYSVHLILSLHFPLLWRKENLFFLPRISPFWNFISYCQDAQSAINDLNGEDWVNLFGILMNYWILFPLFVVLQLLF